MNPENWGFLPDESVRAGRMLSRGRLTATVTSARTGDHVTVQLICKSKSDSDRWVDAPFASATHVFARVPRPDDFRGDKIGIYYPQKGTFWADGYSDPARVFALKQVLLYAAGLPVHPQVESVQESLFCGKCGRELTDPISIERGIGPTCFGQETGSRHEQKQKSEA